MTFKLPIWFLVIKNNFERFGKFMASIFNFIFLIPVYFVGVGIVSVIGKINGKEFLNLGPKGVDNKETYWKTYDLRKEENEAYYRMF